MPDSLNLRHKESASHKFGTSSEGSQSRAAESATLLEGSCRRSDTSAKSGVLSGHAIVPRGNTRSEEECSETQQQSRGNSQTKARDRPGILRLIGPNRRHLENDKNAETAHEERQTGENSTAQSHQSPKRRRLESTAPSSATNEARQANRAVQSSLNQLHPSSI